MTLAGWAEATPILIVTYSFVMLQFFPLEHHCQTPSLAAEANLPSSDMNRT